MGRLFSLDSPLMRFLSRMADLMILNLLVLFVSLPVITAGAAFTAMHYVLIKMVRNEETYIAKMFFKSFKENFVQATILWIITIAVGAIFAIDYLIFIRGNMEFSIVFIIAILAAFVFYLMTVMYVFPLQARFYNTIGKTIKNALLFMILNFPKSILMLIVYALPILVYLLSPYAVPFLIMFGFSVPALGAVYLYRKAFARFEPEAEALTADMDFKVDMGEEEDGEADSDTNADAAGEAVDEPSEEPAVESAEDSGDDPV